MARASGERHAGALVVIGGADEREGRSEILAEFVRLAGGPRARVVVVSVASETPNEVAPLYLDIFRQLGVAEARSLDITSRARAEGAPAAAAVERATGVFFTGGNQLRITRLLRATAVDEALHRRRGEGLVLAGTSAGAAMVAVGGAVG